MRTRSRIRVCSGLALILLAGCGSPAPDRTEQATGTAASGTEPGGTLRIATVNYPLAYFAGRIGGDRVEVEFPAPADVDPAFWSPPPETVARYQQADRILLNGAGYARWITRVSLPPTILVDTSVSFRDRYIAIADAPVHTHGPEGDHSHGELAFTTWLDPTLALAQAAAVRESLVQAAPSDAVRFDEGYEALAEELQGLDREMQAAFGDLGGEPLLASHPVYQYLARRYGLDLRSVHFEPGEDPDPAAWGDLQAMLSAHPARWMLWEGEPGAALRDRLQEIGVGSIVFDPCGNRPGTGDYLQVMRNNLENLREIAAGE